MHFVDFFPNNRNKLHFMNLHSFLHECVYFVDDLMNFLLVLSNLMEVDVHVSTIVFILRLFRLGDPVRHGHVEYIIA